jgi:hypothetical protein
MVCAGHPIDGAAARTMNGEIPLMIIVLCIAHGDAPVMSMAIA